MDNYRLKVKLGDFEFDAEGPHDVVQTQFLAFQEMVAKLPTAPSAVNVSTPVNAPTPTGANTDTTPPKNDTSVDSLLSKIMKVENRVVSLTAAPPNVDDAALLLLYGQRMMRDNETATGSEIVDGLMATGGLDIGRSERLFERIARNGDLIMIGERRGKKYRLTNAGVNKARQIAANMIALVSF
jgi:hypothetical protein